MNFASKELCEKLQALSGWENTADKPAELKVWTRRYSTWEMGAGNEDYKKPGIPQHGVHAYDWYVTDDPRHKVTTGQEVFKWWYGEVRDLEEASVPAYDLGFIIRKLADEVSVTVRYVNPEMVLAMDIVPAWLEKYVTYTPHMKQRDYPVADTAEEAVAMLALTLFEQGLLQKELV